MWKGEEPHLESRVGNMWVFKGEKLATERTLVVLNGLVNLEKTNRVEMKWMQKAMMKWAEQGPSWQAKKPKLRAGYLLQVLIDGDMGHDVLPTSAGVLS